VNGLTKRAGAITAVAATLFLAACSSAATPAPTAAPASAAPAAPVASSAPASVAPASVAPASAAPASAAPTSITIGIALSTLNNPYFVTMENAAKAEAAAKGVTLIVADGQNDLAKQTSEIEDFISKKVNGIIVNPVDSNGIVPAIKEANAANIPVIAADRAVGPGAQTAEFIASDNVQAGKLSASACFKALGGKGSVAVLTGTPGASATNDRTKGLQEALAAYPGIKVVAEQTAQFDRATALTVMENILQAHPDIVGLFSENDEMSLGAIQALKGVSKAGTVKVCSIDGEAAGLAAVQAGTIFETVGQQPAYMATRALDDLVTLARGGTIQGGFIAAPLNQITKANVAQFIGK
jgi:ABC-type sugar transport system substrate-binding protein